MGRVRRIFVLCGKNDKNRRAKEDINGMLFVPTDFPKKLVMETSCMFRYGTIWLNKFQTFFMGLYFTIFLFVQAERYFKMFSKEQKCFFPFFKKKK